MLSLRDVSLRLGSTVLLDRANASIEAGERVCLLGRNGMGKSTLLKLVQGEISPDDGDIIRSPGLKVARLAQDVPEGNGLRVLDVVAAGLGELGAVLARYHALLDDAEHHLAELGRLQARIDAADGWSMDERVQAVVTRLQLPAEQLFDGLSGGLKRRVLLGQALVQEPELLLLDEPTNHLDVEAIDWLEKFLLDFPGAILFVTHDRAFLRRLATRILELDRGWLTSWPGDYENFLRRKEERAHAEAQERAQFDKLLAQEEAWIRKGIEARRTRNQGRVERLKQLRDAYAQRRNGPGQARMQITEAERSGKLVAELKGLSYEVGGRSIVRNLSTTVLRGDKLGIVGPNGAGKTTLINLLLGQLPPTQGELRLGTNIEVAYFDQLRAGLDENLPVFENLGEGKDYVEVGGQRKHVMGYLQDFLFTPDRARSPVRVLSGGERNRLLLARLFAKPSNLLVLDEPTNDLDLETLELLEELLMQYEGTVLLVSHDRAFIDNIVTRCLVFEGDGRVGEYVGGYTDWLRQRPAPAVVAKPAASATVAAKPAAARPAASLSARELRELAELPAKIERLEKEQAELAARMSAPAFYAQDAAAQNKVSKALADVDAALGQAYARWEALETLRES
jgi:ATP-binding cassette subfamily F protein uup